MNLTPLGSEHQEVSGAVSFHDLAVAQIVKDGGTHAPCPDCIKEPEVHVATYDETQLKAEVARAVAEAVAAAETKVRAELEPRLTELTDAQREAAQAAAVATAVSAATAPLNEQVAKLQEDLDAKTLEASGLQTQVAAFEEATTKAEADRIAAEQAALRVDRVREVAADRPGLDKWIEDNTERWLAMDEDKFTATLEGYKDAMSAMPAPAGGLPRPTTAMTATAGGATKSATGATGFGALLREIRDLRPAGADRS